jgi:integrase
MLKTFKHPKYTYTKNGIYYFSIAVPSDLESHYSRKRIIQSLRTKSKEKAKQSAQLLAGRLIDYWFHLRLKNTEPPLAELITTNTIEDDCISINEALKMYVDVKGVDRTNNFKLTAARNVGYLKSCIGNKSLNQYTLKDASKLRDWLLSKNLTTSTVHRVFAGIKAVFNFAVSETGLEIKNPFSAIYLPPEKGVKRKPISIENLNKIKQECYRLDDDVRHLVAIISDTGMRLAEAAGLTLDDIQLDCDYPHVIVRPHPHRRLKTAASERVVPLVGASLWAAKRIIETNNHTTHLCFPRYASVTSTNSNSASAAINKWLKTIAGDSAVIHGMRHSFRDRLRAVEAPIEIIDELGGWAKKTVGQGYGDGYQLEQLRKWVSKITSG